ncbi:Protein saf1 [Vanrija pseudolonga]|uniref:Protein saf1 n=1 Tax=Vanrija pseudolonga TaxID=143232 RepID=A0AAF1BHE6_9TREE|nr:Protein saf1 [Vanrija pseudolonga]
MAKKSANPADAFRKAQRAKEIKKNKDERKKKRDEKTVKRDTRDLEGEIKSLKAASSLNDEQKARLTSLESELKYVSKLKDKYVKAHPDAADRVYNTERRGGDRPGTWRRPEDEADAESSTPAVDPRAHLYHPDGTLRDPKRSAYYHATYNPFGVPPPGMPYKERDDLPSSDESSDDEDEEDSDSDIVMPEGPRPGEESDADSDDSDDIPLPEGPPPPRLPPGGPPAAAPFGGPPPPFGAPPFGAPPFPVPPFARPPRPAFTPVTAPGVGWGHLMDAPTPPQRRPQNGAGAGPSRLPAPPASLPAKPGTATSASVIATSTTKSTATSPPGSSSSGAPPTAPAPSQASNTSAAASAGNAKAATISAAPQLRDLRKETTVFVPRGVKRRAPGVPSVNATPGAGVVDADGDVVKRTSDSGPGLLGKLQAVGVAPTPRGGGGRVGAGGHAASAGVTGTEAEDDYERFLEGLE